MAGDRSAKQLRNADMHVAGESDRPIVPKKSANKDRDHRVRGRRHRRRCFEALLSAESMEGRGLTEENIEPSPLGRTQCRNVVGKPSGKLSDGKSSAARSRGLLGVREAARNDTKVSQVQFRRNHPR